jgi:oligosaccharide 4-alpha-D-glucosyltransferase
MRFFFRFWSSMAVSLLLISCDTSTLIETSTVDSLTIDLDHGRYLIKALDNGAVAVKFSNDTIKSEDIYGPEQVQSVPFDLEVSSSAYKLSTVSTDVQITFEPFTIQFFDKQGNLRLTNAGGITLENDSTYLNFELSQDESIYGTGFRALPLNRRGEKLLVYNRPQYGYGWGEKNLNYTIPHWTSSRNYGLMIDNPARATLDIGATVSTSMTYASKGGNLVYYYIPGDNQKELLVNLTELTGRQPLPPRWAFGNLQSRFGYRNQEEAENILKLALGAGYPVDAIILDIYWFGPELEDGQMGRLDWDLDRWPDPKGMIDRFRTKGVRTISVSEPFFTRKAKHYPFLSENQYLALDKEGNTYDIQDFYFGVGGLLDVFNPKAKSWMWDQYRYIRSFGVDGLWVDLGEPEKHPHDMVHANGLASQIHGAYGHEWARMLYDGYREDYPDERLFHMGRSGFVGTHRYGLIPWTGDVGRGWSGLKAQIPAILSMGMSGLGYMHSDAGGFSMIDKGDPELYIRWLQLSVFTSIFRPHADAVVPPEPVFWDEPTQAIAKELINLRYALLPYHYTLAFENSRTGLPFVRPMIMEYPDASDTLFQQFMYGSDLLVAPIIERGEDIKRLFLPEGDWYDWQSRERIEGGQMIFAEANLDKVPIYVKSGAIIPTSPDNRHAGSYNGEQLTLTYFIDDNSSTREFFFDNGIDPSSIAANRFETLMAQVDVSGSRMSFTVDRSGSYPDTPSARDITWQIVGLTHRPSGLPSNAVWNTQSKILTYQISIENKGVWHLTMP